MPLITLSDTSLDHHINHPLTSTAVFYKPTVYDCTYGFGESSYLLCEMFRVNGVCLCCEIAPVRITAQIEAHSGVNLFMPIKDEPLKKAN